MISSHAATTRRREEQRLLQLYHGAGDAGAREELVHRFLPLARQLARRYQRRGEPIDDLEQVASLGLLKAIDREILRLRFGEDLHQTEIAERVGVSPTHVARLLRRSIEALHETTTHHPANRVAATRDPAG